MRAGPGTNRSVWRYSPGQDEGRGSSGEGPPSRMATGEDMAASDTHDAIAVLHASHDHLVSVVESLPGGDVRAQSYCDDWSIAQVLSHLGSGAEIALAHLRSAVNGSPTPDREYYLGVWSRWDAMEPEEMASNFIPSDLQLIAEWEQLDDPTLERIELDFNNQKFDAASAILRRLGEHAIHAWDVEVMANEAALVAPRAVDLLVGWNLGRIGRLARGARPESAPTSVAVRTSAPDRAFSLEIADDVTVGDAAEAPSTASLSAEAFVRLTVGRLDVRHTPDDAEVTGALSLQDLRTLFTQG